MESIYDVEELDAGIEEDEISSEEAGFMRGYLKPI